MVDTKDKQFLIELVEFYKSFIGNTQQSIEKLAIIQDKFPKGYANLVKLQHDPSVLLEISNQIDDNERRIMLDLFFMASSISKKLSLLYELTSDEKRKLITDIENFSKRMDKNLESINGE